jgi:ADP-ribose pyrophosphatase YjhB (NUDIX family)
MKFHYLVRALIISGDYILLAREIGTDNTFLPGGHVEQGESAEKALTCELEEETGHSASIIGF